MTLRKVLAAQLALQADLTCVARPASAFTLSALARTSLADLLAHARASVSWRFALT